MKIIGKWNISFRLSFNSGLKLQIYKSRHPYKKKEQSIVGEPVYIDGVGKPSIPETQRDVIDLSVTLAENNEKL